MGVDATLDKAAVAKALAERFVAGEFGGIAYRASQEPEAISKGVISSHIQYYMNQFDPAACFFPRS